MLLLPDDDLTTEVSFSCSFYLCFIDKILVAPLNRNANLNSARIMSPARKGTQCLSLRALIIQQTSLNLSVKVRFAVEGDERKREETIIAYSGNQGGDWFNVRQTVFMPPTISYQVKTI